MELTSLAGLADRAIAWLESDEGKQQLDDAFAFVAELTAELQNERRVDEAAMQERFTL